MKKGTKKQAGPLFWLLATLFLALIVGVAGVRLGFARHTRPAWSDPLLVPAAPYGMPAEAVQLTTRDGVVLRGHFLPGDAKGAVGGQATVVLLHDDAKRGMYDVVPVYAPPLVTAGYNVLAVSFRGYGASAGEMVGGFFFGQERAQRDVAAMLDWLAARPETQGRPIGLLALGDSALPALRAADRVQAMVLDSAPSSGSRAWAGEYPWTRYVPGIRPAIKALGSLSYQANLFGREPADWARHVNVPTLLIHGEADTVQDPAQAGVLQGALPAGQGQLLLAPGAPHLATAQMYPDAYWQAVLRHLALHLAKRPELAPPAVTALTPTQAAPAFAPALAGRQALARGDYAAAAASLTTAATSNPADLTLRYLAGVAHIATRDVGEGLRLLTPLATQPPPPTPGPDLAALQCWAQVWVGHGQDLIGQRDTALQAYAYASGCTAVGPDPSGLEPVGPQERARYWLNQAYTAPLR